MKKLIQKTIWFAIGPDKLDPHERDRWNQQIKQWSALRRLGESAVVRSSRVWLLLVPIAAKMLQPVQGIHTVDILGSSFSVNLKLPFSWQMLFAASLCFACGTFIYDKYCPKLIRLYRTYSDFVESKSGRVELANSLMVLMDYNAIINRGWGENADSIQNYEIGTYRALAFLAYKADEADDFCNAILNKDSSTIRSTYTVTHLLLISNPPEDRRLPDVFNLIHNIADLESPRRRIWCDLAFRLGFLFLAILLVQNIVWVISASI